MATLRVRAEHVSDEQAYRQVRARHGVDEIDDAVAVTIASWWQSPGTVGRHLAALASGAEVDHADLLDDIAATRQAENYYGSSHWPRMSSDDRDALDMLATWTLQRTASGTRDYAPAAHSVMRYASIAFLQGDEASEALDVIERRGPQAGISHLAQWLHESDPYCYETYDEPPNGADDHVHLDGNLILSWSHQYGYAGLAMRFVESA